MIKIPVGCFVLGDYTTQLYIQGLPSYIKSMMQIPINQPEFHGMSLVVGFDRCCQEPGEEEDEEPDLSPCVAAVVLAIATVLTSYSTDFLIDSIEGTHIFGRSV